MIKQHQLEKTTCFSSLSKTLYTSKFLKLLKPLSSSFIFFIILSNPNIVHIPDETFSGNSRRKCGISGVSHTYLCSSPASQLLLKHLTMQPLNGSHYTVTSFRCLLSNYFLKFGPFFCQL